MAKKSKKVAAKSKPKSSVKPIEQYEHLDKERVNNPHIGLVSDRTDAEYGQNKKKYQYDPHLDPHLQWAGKAERISFEVPTVSLHVHERIDPKTIIDSVKAEKTDNSEQLSLFEKDKKPLREAIEFYKHKEGWSNRLVAGDSLLIMNSLLEKEGMGGKVQMVYFDPPYGIKYGSNFQPFVNKRDVKDGSDEDLTQEPEMIKAFRDTWELGIHSYLSYLRDRLLLAKELLHESGSVFVQISDENIHHVREIMDEVFQVNNFCSVISFRKTTGQSGNLLPDTNDYIIWYAKKKETSKFRTLFQPREGFNWVNYDYVKLPDGTHRKMTEDEMKNSDILPKGSKVYRRSPLTSTSSSEATLMPVKFEGKTYTPGKGGWKTNERGFENLKKANRLEAYGETLSYRRYADDFPFFPISNSWTDTASGGYGADKIYVVQTNLKVLQRCMLLTTDPGDLVLDITCGSGTTAMASEQWGRRWITCDTSRVAVALAKQRLLTANFDYYPFSRPDEGISGGFQYKTTPHIMLKNIANNEPPGIEVLFDQPNIDSSKTRVTGPFTVESIPAPFVKNLDEETDYPTEGDASVSRTGETLRQDQWRDELQRTGARGKGGAILQFSRIEAQEGTRYIQAVGETKPAPNAASGEAKPQKVLIVFGPEHAPLDARVVELAIEEARQLKHNILLFCAFQFDEEAAKDIDETPEKLLGFKLLKAHMNMDLQTDDLKKQKTGNQSFWLIGQPDVRVQEIEKGDDKGKVKIEVAGFDYYDPKTGAILSGGSKNIAMWMLDTDYDGRSLFPRQIFFPMSGPKDGWSRLAKNLKAEIDEEKIEAFRGTVSLPFTPGKLIAVKIIDDRGIESLKIIKR
jgi:adenine-specific DNA-methyltransferase